MTSDDLEPDNQIFILEGWKFNTWVIVNHNKGIQTGLYEIQPTRSENAIIGEMKELNCFPGSKHFWLQCSDDTGCNLIVPSPKFDLTDNYLTIKNVEASDGGRYR